MKVSKYLPITPELGDYLLMTDVSNNKKTVGVSVQSLVQLINGVNGTNALQFQFSEEGDEVGYDTIGHFFSGGNELDPGSVTKLIFNKSTLYPIDISPLFSRLSELENITIKLINPSDPNNFMQFNIENIEEQEDSVVLFVTDTEGFYSGNFIENQIYSVVFDITVAPQINDNIMKRKYVIHHSPTISLLEIVNRINQGVTIVFGEDEVPPMIIVFHLAPNGLFTYKYLLADKGRGTYGLNGTPLTINDIEQVFYGLINIEDAYADPETDFFNLGDITGTNVSVIVNSQNPPLEFQPFNEGLVIINVTNNGVNEAYLFLGGGGIYGVGANQTTMADFELFESGNNVITNTSQLENDGDGTSPFATENEVAAGIQSVIAQFSNYVPLNGNAIVNNVKDFTSSPLVPEATTNNAAVPLHQVEEMVQTKPDYYEVVLQTEKAVPNGVSTLDGNGKVPLEQINDALLGNVNYQGIYNASTNTPNLTTVLPKGQYYIVGTAGTQFGISFEVGDWIISNGVSYNKVDNTDAVSSVAGLVGVITVENLRSVLENVTKVSIQNSNGVEQFTLTEALRIKGVSFNPLLEQIEVNPLVGGVIFVSNTGNDATAQVENRALPFKTLNAAIDAYFANPSIDKIEIVSATSFITDRMPNDGTARVFQLTSEKACTVLFNGTGAINASGQNINFNLLQGALIFVPATETIGFRHGNHIININTDSVEFGLGFETQYSGNGTVINIVTNIIDIKTTSGVLTSPSLSKNLNIKTNVINFRGAGAFLGGVRLNLDFNMLTHDNTFIINNAGPTIINHGSVDFVSPYLNSTFFTPYFSGNLNIKFKQGSVINSNIGISCFNQTGLCTIEGTVKIPNSEALLTGNNSDTNIIEIENANITIKKIFTYRCRKGLKITSSTFTLSEYFGDFIDNASSASFEYPTPTIKFVGTNYIFLPTKGMELLYPDDFVHPNVPSVDVTQGILYTNGKFDRSKFDIIEEPLNQYYDTTQRQLVIVNEKEEIANIALDPTKTYMVDGLITFFAGDYIYMNDTSTIAGYGFDVSALSKNVAGESLFKSTTGKNIVLRDLTISSGSGEVFDVQDVDGTHALEFNDVNFDFCSSIGSLKGYRQFTGQTIGMYGCSDGFELDGAWQGFVLSKLHIRGFSPTGTLFKKGANLSFSNRFSAGVNLSCQSGTKITDFNASNFTKDKSFQLDDCTIEVDGVIDTANTAALIPNISANNPKCKWTNSEGITITAVDFTDIKSANKIWRMTVDDAGLPTYTDIT